MRERDDYISILPRPLKHIAQAYVQAGRNAVIKQLSSSTIGIHIIGELDSKELSEPKAVFTVPTNIADVM